MSGWSNGPVAWGPGPSVQPNTAPSANLLDARRGASNTATSQLDASSNNGEGSGNSAKLKEAPSFRNAGPMVEINVGSGKSKMKYLVYKNFATYFSPVFDRAFNGKFMEAKTQTYSIDDFEFPDAFALVVKWMYSKSLGTGWGDPDEEQVTVEDLCRVWVLGDRLMMPELQDCASSSLCYRITLRVDHGPHPLAAAAWIYEETGPNSPLRRLFAAKCAYELRWGHGITSDEYELPDQFAADIGSVYQRDAISCRNGHNCNDNGWANPPFEVLNHHHYKVNVAPTGC